MAISRVGATNGNTTADQTTVTVTRSVTAGNGGILVIASHGAAAVTVTTVSDGTNTWTQAAGIATNVSAEGGDLWYCKSFAATGSITVTVTWAASASATGAVTLIEVTGQDTSTFFDVGKSTGATTASCVSGNTTNLAQTNEFCVGAFAGNGNNTFSSAAFATNPGSITAETVSNGTTSGHKCQVAAFDMVGGTSGSVQSFSVTDSASSAGVTICACFKAATGTPHTATPSLTVTPAFANTVGYGVVPKLTVTPAFANTVGYGVVPKLTVTPHLAATGLNPHVYPQTPAIGGGSSMLKRSMRWADL